MPSSEAVRRAALLVCALGSVLGVSGASAQTPGPTGTPTVQSRSTDSVSWTWGASTDADEYEVFLSSDLASAYAVVTTTGFTHSGLGPNGPSSIIVRGVNASNDGPYSEAATAHSEALAPDSVSVSSATSVYAVVTWNTAGNPFPTFYDLQVSVSAGAFNPYSTYTVANATVTGLSAATNYAFKVRAYNNDFLPTAFSASASTDTPAAGGTPPPDPVDGLNSVFVSTDEIVWSWNPAPGALGYRVYAATSPVLPIGEPSGNSFHHAALGPNADSGILVSAWNDTGESPQAGPGSKSTLARDPSSLAVTAASTGTVGLSWSANGNPAGTVYEVRKTSQGAGFTTHSTYSATTALIAGLPSNTTWEFLVLAYNDDAVATGLSNVVSTRTQPFLPGPPGALSSVFVSTAEASWSWGAATNADEYEVRLASQSADLLAVPSSPGFTHSLGPNALSSLIVRGSNADGAGPFTSTASVFTLARTPVNLSTVAVTSIYVSLSWEANGNPSGTTYLVEKSTNDVDYANHSTYTVTVATVTGLSPSTTYFFRARAVNDDMVFTAYSGTVSTVTSASGGVPPPGQPGAPVQTVLSTAEVSWEWTPASDADSYAVVLASKTAEVIASPATTSFIHASLAPNALSGILVRGVNATGQGPFSSGGFAYSLAMAPASLAVGAVGYDSVALSWDAQGNADGTNFQVEHSTEGGSFALVATTTEASRTVSSLAPSATQHFRVRALNGDGAPSAYSATASTFTLPPPPPAPGTPTALVLSTGDVSWSWASSTETASFEVFLATKTSELLSAPATDSFVLTGLSPNQPSAIVVRGINATGPSPLSQAATAYTFAMTPASLAAVSAASTTIDLSWSANGNPAGTVFELQKASDGATFLAYSTYTAAAATVESLPPDATFEFRVRAYNDDAVPSAFSNTVSTGTTPALPGVPGTPGPVVLTTGVVTWSWGAASDALTYEVALASKSAELLAAPAVSSFTLTLGPNEPSAIVVRGVNAAGTGPLSASATAYTLAMPPESLAATSVSSHSASLSWSANGNPMGTLYELQLSSAGGPFALAASTTSTSYTVPGLSSAAAVDFRVRAANAGAVLTAFSNTASTQTLAPLPGPPGTPAAAFLTTGVVTWAWTAGVDALSYEVFLASKAAELLAAPTVSSFTLTLGPNEPSGIVVRGVNASGAGPLSGPATAYTLAMPPAGLTVTGVSATSVDLVWGPAGNAGGTLYEVEASSGAGYYAAGNTTALSASVSSLSSATAYDFRVRALNGDGLPSAYSGTASTQTNGTGGQPLPGTPGTPGTVFISTDDVSWSWTAASDASGYKVYPASATEDLIAAPTTPEATFTGLGPNAPSGIVVRGVNAVGDGPLSAPATAYTFAAAPAALNVDEVFFTSVSLSWSAAGNPAGTEFELQKSTDGALFLAHSTYTAAAAILIDLSTDTSFDFRVRAFNADAVPTAYSNIASTRTLSTLPGATGTPSPVVLSTGDVSWSWGAASLAEGYELRLASDTAQLLSSTTATSTVLSGYGPNAVSSVVVRAVNAAGAGPLSASSAAYTLSLTPDPPAGPGASSTTLHLVWGGEGNPAGTVYELQTATDGASFAAYSTYAVTEATVPSLTASTTYEFRLRAFNGDGVATAFSAVLSTGTTPPFPGPPGTPAPAFLSTGAVTWAWTAASDAASYEVYLASKTAELVAAPAVSSFTLVLGANEPSAIIVRGVNALGPGPLSASATAYTLAMPPAGLAVADVSANTADLFWASNGNSAGTVYELETSSGAGFYGAGNSTALSAAVSSLSSATAYDFRVRARNGDGVYSAYSNTASTQTDPLGGALPGQPGTPFAVFVSSDDVLWTWAGDAGASGYKVFSASSPTTLLALAATTSYELRGVGPNVPSAIVVAGTNTFGDGPLSGTATAYTLALPPQSLAFASVFASSLTLSWDAAGNPAGTEFELQQSLEGVVFFTYTTTTASGFTAVSLSSDTRYDFRVRARNGSSVNTAFSNAVSTFTAPLLPGTPGAPAAVFVSTAEVVWSWSPAAQASSYLVYLASKTAELIASPGTNSFTRSGVGANALSGVVVRGTNVYGGGPLSASATAYTLAQAPASLSFTAVSSASIGLAWSANGNPPGTVYELQSSSDGGTYAAYSTYTSAGASLSPLPASTTYFFRVLARNGDMVDSGFSNAVSTRTLPPPPGAPGTPVGAALSTADVSWNWAPAVDAAAYEVFLASKASELLASVSTTAYVRAGLAPNAPSGVVIRAVNATGAGPLSAAATAYSLAADPSSLVLLSVSSSAVGLSWSADGNPAGTVYELQLSTDGAGFAAYSTYTLTTATAAPLSASSPYYFRVRSRNADLVDSGFSNAVSTTTRPPLPGIPGTPAAVAPSTDDLSWSWAPASDAAGYEVYLASKTAELLASTGAPALDLSSLGPNALSAIVVRGVNATGAGPLSPAATAHTPAMPPAALAFVAVSSTAASLSWSANGNPAGTLYELESSSDGAAYAGYSTFTASAADLGPLPPSTTFFFRVRSRNGDGVAAAYSNAVSTRTLPPSPGVPGVPVAVVSSTGDVSWSWAPASDAAAYQVFLATKTSELLAVPATTQFVLPGLTPDFPSAIVVRGVNASGAGPLSAAATAYTLAMPPTALSLASVSSAAAALTWSANGNPVGTVYELQVSSDDSSYASAGTFAAPAGTVSSLEASTTYFFRVRARNGGSVDTAFATAVSTRTKPPLPGAPGTPAAVGLSTSGLSWTWSAAMDAFSYEVFLASKTAELLASLTTEALSLSGFGPNERSAIVVRGVNPSGPGPLSAPATAHTLAMDPASLAATGVSSASVGLAWSANGNPSGTLYELQMAPFGGLLEAYSTYTVTAVTVPALSPSTTYFFRVLARNDDGVESGFSNVLSSVTLPTAPGQPGLPQGAALGVSSIQWTWSAASEAAGYLVYQASSPGAAIGSPATGLFVQSALPPNTAAGLLVAGVNPSGLGPLSDAATVYTLAAVPAGTAATAVHQTSASLAWSLNGNPAGTVAEVERSTDGSAFASVFLGSGTVLDQSGLLVCTSYWFRIRNFNGDGLASAYDSASLLTRAATPTAPGGLSAAALAGNRISLAWSPSGSESVTEYRLYWDAGSGSVSYAAPLAVIPSSATGHVTGVLASSAAYRFGLRAYNRCGIEEANTGVAASAPSLAALTGVKTALSGPLSGQRVKGDRVTLTATRTLGEAFQLSSVRFQYKPSSASAWSDVATDAAPPYFAHWDADALGVAAEQSFDLRAVAFDVSGGTDAAPSAVTVSVVPAAAADYDVAEGLVGGKVQKAQQLDNNVTSVVETGGTLATRLTIPSGALDAATVTVRLINDAGAPPSVPGAEGVGQAVQIDLLSGQTQLAGGRTAAVTLGYPDADGDGVVDGTTVRADRLVMYSAPVLAGPWTRDFASSVDATNRSVTGNTPHFSFFALFAVAAAGLDSVRVYPVPYMPNSGNPDQGAPFSAGNANSGIVFDNLPDAVTIKVYTVTGQRVAQFGSDASGGKVQWDVKNDRGQDVASGGYIAVISSPGASPVTKRILIVR